ncbi:hypothetical protein F8S13_17745 [Chloroflexia bacterium SDU3-3]|nr:hypothetical protein F8S13_17745 [Chloroflexia bacterium SDU3-3]
MVSQGTLHIPLEHISIDVGSAAWFAWLAEDAHCSFHFSHRAGDFTARKERRQRGGHYWAAYRHCHGKIYKLYLGKPETLDEARLCACAQELARTIGNSEAIVAPNP